MRIGQIISTARDMEIDPKWAISCRKRYLSAEIFRRQMDFEYWIAAETDDFQVALVYIEFAIREIQAMAALKIEIKRLDDALLQESRPGQITDEQIAQAREYPISNLVEFRHGKAVAPCHDDRHPSMYHATRTNKANCPVCDRSWGPIDWLVEIEGKSFVEAVRELTHT